MLLSAVSIRRRKWSHCSGGGVSAFSAAWICCSRVQLGLDIGARSHRHDCAGVGRRWPGTKRRPGLHELSPLVEQIAAAIGTLDFAADGVSERHVDNDLWKVA